MKTAVLAYINNSFIIPDEYVVRQIQQLLSMQNNMMQNCVEEGNISTNQGKILIGHIQQLEREILVLLHNPKTLEQWIIEVIQEFPSRKSEIYQVLDNISNDGSKKSQPKIRNETIDQLPV